MKFFGKHIWLVVAMFGVSQVYAQTSAMQGTANGPVKAPVLVQEKATVDSSNSDTQNTSASGGSSSKSKAGASAVPVKPADKNLSSNAKSAKPLSADENTYPALSKMEVITFGQAKPNVAIEQRLTDLEKAVFQKSFEGESLFDRTQKLKLTILGPGELEPADQDFANAGMMTPFMGELGNSAPVNTQPPEVNYFELIAQNAENQTAVDEKNLPGFALQILNNARAQLDLPLLTEDKVAAEMAEAHGSDLHKRKLVSHLNGKGENPDLRYTNMGGGGTVIESIISLKPAYVKDNKYTRALVAYAFKLLLEHQDDREGLLSPDATGFGFALKLLHQQKRAVACVEISTNHGAIAPLLLPLKVGNKIEVQGSIQPPYTFAKLTLAWEGMSGDVPAAADETAEALPYFPPLDYVGYKHKGEHDYSTAMAALRMGCLVGVMAGSMFMPPIALAAPLIMMAPTVNGELKPVSDIPLHGGVKVEDNNFSVRVPLSHANKPGIYYVTVWANTSKNGKPIPISRRAYNLTEVFNLDSSEVAEHANKAANKEATKEAKAQAKEAKDTKNNAANNMSQYQQ